MPDLPRARVFDSLKHSFNPLKSITYKKAREIADILSTVSPQGENTLTVRNGKRADSLELLDKTDRDYGNANIGPNEALATVDDV